MTLFLCIRVLFVDGGGMAGFVILLPIYDVRHEKA